MSDWVLDASAILANILDEPGAALVHEKLPEAIVSAVNLSEVATKLIDRGLPAAETAQRLSDLPFGVAAFDQDQAILAGHLRGPTRAAGLSLGDRACLALAMSLGLPAITADRAWLDIADTIGVEIVLARPDP